MQLVRIVFVLCKRYLKLLIYLYNISYVFDRDDMSVKTRPPTVVGGTRAMGFEEAHPSAGVIEADLWKLRVRHRCAL